MNFFENVWNWLRNGALLYLILFIIMVVNNIYGTSLFAILTSVFLLGLNYDTIKLFLNDKKLERIKEENLDNQIKNKINFLKLIFQIIVFSSELSDILLQLLIDNEFCGWNTEISSNFLYVAITQFIITLLAMFVILISFNCLSAGLLPFKKEER